MWTSHFLVFSQKHTPLCRKYCPAMFPIPFHAVYLQTNHLSIKLRHCENMCLFHVLYLAANHHCRYLHHCESIFLFPKLCRSTNCPNINCFSITKSHFSIQVCYLIEAAIFPDLFTSSMSQTVQQLTIIHSFIFKQQRAFQLWFIKRIVFVVFKITNFLE